jgi:hypothetical protein
MVDQSVHWKPVFAQQPATFDGKRGCDDLLKAPKVICGKYQRQIKSENAQNSNSGILFAGAPAIGSFLFSTQSPQRDFALVGAGVGINAEVLRHNDDLPQLRRAGGSVGLHGQHG